MSHPISLGVSPYFNIDWTFYVDMVPPIYLEKLARHSNFNRSILLYDISSSPTTQSL